MSYITNLVQRTLGITPVVQPVIQAKFAPRGSGSAAIGQETASERPASTVAEPNAKSAPDETTAARPTTDPSPTAITGAVRNIVVHEVVEQTNAMARTGSVKLGTAERLEDRAAAKAPRNSEPVIGPQRSSGPLPEDTHTEGGFRLMNAVARAVALPRSMNSSSAQAPPTVSEFSEAPVVRVHIGRVDVRMVQENAKESRLAPRSASEARPTSLNDYLRDKLRGQR